RCTRSATARSKGRCQPWLRPARATADCRLVAFPITRSALLLRPAADPERELDLGLLAPVTWPLIRETSSVRCRGGARAARPDQACGVRLSGRSQITLSGSDQTFF